MDGVNVWEQTMAISWLRSAIMLTDITFRKRERANHQSTGSISKSDTPKRPRSLGKPYAIMRSEMGPAMSIKIEAPLKATRSSMLHLLDKPRNN